MNNLKYLRKERKMTQTDMGKLLNISYQAYANYENGSSEPSIDTLMKLAEIFDMSVDCLLGNETYSDIKASKKGVKIPVLGYVQAGIPVDAIEEIIDYEEITTEMARSGEHFGLIVRGDSMEPRFAQGDVVIVKKQPDVDNGQIAVVLVNGEEGTIKKIRKSTTGITLLPSNPQYEPQFYSNKEIAALPVEILGRVVELRAKF